MPVAVAWTAPRRTVRCATVRHGGGCMPPHTPGCAAPRHVPLGETPGRRVGGGAGAQSRGGDLPRQGACRGGCLPAPDSLPAIRPCRGAWGAAAGFSRGAWVRPSRQAPLAGVSIFCLVYFVLEWSYMGSVVPARSSCRGLASLARQAPLAGGLVLNAWSSLGASWAGLAAGCYNCPCTSWGTKVPPALVHRHHARPPRRQPRSPSSPRRAGLIEKEERSTRSATK